MLRLVAVAAAAGAGSAQMALLDCNPESNNPADPLLTNPECLQNCRACNTRCQNEGASVYTNTFSCGTEESITPITESCTCITANDNGYRPWDAHASDDNDRIWAIPLVVGIVVFILAMLLFMLFFCWDRISGGSSPPPPPSYPGPMPGYFMQPAQAPMGMQQGMQQMSMMPQQQGNSPNMYGGGAPYHLQGDMSGASPGMSMQVPYQPPSPQPLPQMGQGVI